MAQIDPSTTTATNTATETERNEGVKVDLATVNFDCPVAYDAEANFFERTSPLPPGVYGVKLFMGPDGWKWYADKNDKTQGFYGIQAITKVVEFTHAPKGTIELYKDAELQWFLSTMVPRGKKTSSIATVMAKMGAPVGKLTSALMTAKNFEKFMKMESIVYVEVDWRCSYKESDDPNLKDWKNLYYTASHPQWPKDDHGNPLDRFEVPVKGVLKTVNVQNIIADCYGKAENIPVNKRNGQKGTATATSTPNAATTGGTGGGTPAPATVAANDDIFNQL